MKMRKLILAGCLFGIALSLCSCSNKKEEAELKEKIEKVEEQMEKEENMETFVYTEVEGGVAITKYNGQGGDVEIPQELDGRKVVEIKNTAFSGNVVINSLKIPPSVQSIENDTFHTQAEVKILGYRNTGAIYYAKYAGIAYEILGENPAQASIVLVYSTTGKECKALKPGDRGTDDYTKGISFEERDGKSVLILDGCYAGSIVVEESASLTIELTEGSNNVLTADAGLDGISIGGNLMITGNGSLEIKGSDYYTLREGEAEYVGNGIVVYGDLTIEKNAKVRANGGSALFLGSNAVVISEGNLIVDQAALEMKVPDDESGSYAVCVYDDGTGKYGNIILNGVQIIEGGSVVDMCESDIVWGSTIGSAGTVTIDMAGYMIGASTYAKIQ